jgi:hypothetical protein
MNIAISPNNDGNSLFFYPCSFCHGLRVVFPANAFRQEEAVIAAALAEPVRALPGFAILGA